ncbi:MAG: PilZ domain-containing protein [Acidobacteriota bacterium]
MFRRKKKKRSGRVWEERRREPRLEDLNQVTLTPRESQEGKGEKRTYYARALNASPGGMKIQTDFPFPVGTVLSIKLHSPKTRKLIQAIGQVKWVTVLEEGRACRLGLEFVETPIRTIMDLLDHIYKA